jgi:hypothetical protein
MKTAQRADKPVLQEVFSGQFNVVQLIDSFEKGNGCITNQQVSGCNAQCDSDVSRAPGLPLLGMV